MAEPVWKIAYLHFGTAATSETINAALAERPGWEPFATRDHPDGGWLLLLKRKVSE